MREPKNLDEMQSVMTLYNDLVNEVPKIEAKFPAISEQISVLDKFNVPIKDSYRKLQLNIPNIWAVYLETLEHANKMINYAKVLLKDSGRI